MPKEFSQFEGPGRKYAPKKDEQRRTPTRNRQVARGKGTPTTEPDIVRSARKAMGRGRYKKT